MHGNWSFLPQVKTVRVPGNSQLLKNINEQFLSWQTSSHHLHDIVIQIRIENHRQNAREYPNSSESQGDNRTDFIHFQCVFFFQQI